MIRVRVLAVRKLRTKLRIGESGQWIELRRPEDEVATDVVHNIDLPGVVLHGPVEVTVGPGGWSILDGRRFRPSVTGMEMLEFRPVEEGQASTVTIQDLPYPGFVRLSSRSDLDHGAYDVVNHVAIESYLPGVLAKELYSHWCLQTHAAQAIAARSFACSELTYFADRRHYDVTNTTASQMYAGAATHGRALEAVEMTRGVVLAHGGYLVPGYYSSCCGGIAANAVDAIGEHPYNHAAPLCGRTGTDVCTNAPRFSWTTDRPTSELLARFAAWGQANRREQLAHAESLREISVADVNAQGRPRTFTIVSARGERVTIKAEELRRAANFATDRLKSPTKRLWSSNVTASITRSTARFVGHGHGHGAGLCQYGAETLAKRGEQFQSILEWYYPEVELTQAYL